MTWFLKFLGIHLFLILVSSAVLAEDLAVKSNVAGYWQTIDDATQKPSAIIHVKRVGDVYQGNIAKIYTITTERSDDICLHCTGDQKDKPILGLTIIKDMQCGENACKAGTILDPRDGKLYHASMTLIEDGQKVKVRGYVGIPLFGKTVVWNRVSHL